MKLKIISLDLVVGMICGTVPDLWCCRRQGCKAHDASFSEYIQCDSYTVSKG